MFETSGCTARRQVLKEEWRPSPDSTTITHSPMDEVANVAQAIIHKPAIHKGSTSYFSHLVEDLTHEDQLSGKKRRSFEAEESSLKRYRNNSISSEENFDDEGLIPDMCDNEKVLKRHRSDAVSLEDDLIDMDQISAFETKYPLSSFGGLKKQTQTLADLSRYITRTPPRSPETLERKCPDSDTSIRTQSSLGLNFDKFCMTDSPENRHTGTPKFDEDYADISSLDEELTMFTNMPNEE